MEAEYEAQHRVEVKLRKKSLKAELALSTRPNTRKNQRGDAEMKLKRKDQEITEFATAYQAGDPQAVIAYNAMVLERSEYPEGFPARVSTGFCAGILASWWSSMNYRRPV